MMRILQLLLAGCLIASFGCDVDNIVSLDTEMLTVSVTTVIPCLYLTLADLQLWLGFESEEGVAGLEPVTVTP